MRVLQHTHVPWDRIQTAGILDILSRRFKANDNESGSGLCTMKEAVKHGNTRDKEEVTRQHKG